MTECPTCGINKEEILKEVDKLEMYVKLLLDVARDRKKGWE